LQRHNSLLVIFFAFFQFLLEYLLKVEIFYAYAFSDLVGLALLQLHYFLVSVFYFVEELLLLLFQFGYGLVLRFLGVRVGVLDC
jgi:hypothetical protein